MVFVSSGDHELIQISRNFFAWAYFLNPEIGIKPLFKPDAQ